MIFTKVFYTAEKNYNSAFEIICIFFFEFGKLDIDDSNGCLDDLMRSIMSYFSKTVELMNPNEKDKTFDWVENHLNDETIIDYIHSDSFTEYIDFFSTENFLQKKIIFFDNWLKKIILIKNLQISITCS